VQFLTLAKNISGNLNAVDMYFYFDREYGKEKYFNEMVHAINTA